MLNSPRAICMGVYVVRAFVKLRELLPAAGPSSKRPRCSFWPTVDHNGRPTVSYKGGPPGFVRITGPGELVFPIYDGNGMFLSLGNIAGSTNVGMLFIDFESPRRLRVQGRAAIVESAALLREYPVHWARNESRT